MRDVRCHRLGRVGQLRMFPKMRAIGTGAERDESQHE